MNQKGDSLEPISIVRKHRKIPHHKEACPFCECKRIIDVRDGVVLECYAEEDMPPSYFPDVITKCPECKNQIGIRVKSRDIVKKPFIAC